MLKKTLKLSAVCAILALSACASNPNAPVQTPAEVAAKVCPSLTVTISSMKDLVGLSEDEMKMLNKASDIVDPICNMEFAKVQTTDLKTLVADAVPMLLNVVKGSSLSDDKKNQFILAVSAAKIVVANLPK